MYKRNSKGWLKHFDFVFLDEICLQISMIFSAYLNLGIFLYSSAPYRSLAFVVVFTDVFIAGLAGTMHNVLRRSDFKEFSKTGHQNHFI